MRINLFSKLSLVCLALFTSSCNTSTSPEPLSLSSSGQSWMSKLPDTLLLSAITIPGTHDAGALYDPVYAPGTTKCQNLSISDQLIAGAYSRQWNAAAMTNGVYFYRLHAGSYTETKKLVLLK